MKKLSAIFETVDTSIGKRQQYLADMFVDSFLYERKLVESQSTMTLHEIETLIAEEAIATGSVKKAEVFLDGIHSKIDEGFTDLVKTAYKKVKAFVMSFLTSNVEKAITTFNNTIKAEKAKLISEALLIYEAEADKKPDEAPVLSKAEEEKAATALISAMKRTTKLSFGEEIMVTKTNKTVKLDDPIFGALNGYSVVLTHDKSKFTIALVIPASSDAGKKINKKNIPMIVLDSSNPSDIFAIIGNVDIVSPIARALVTSILFHFTALHPALTDVDIAKLQAIRLGLNGALGEVKKVTLTQFNIPGKTSEKEETPPTDPVKDPTEHSVSKIETVGLELAKLLDIPTNNATALFAKTDLDENGLSKVVEKVKKDKTLLDDLKHRKTLNMDLDFYPRLILLAEDETKQKVLITELITLAKATETPELTKLLLAFTEADLEGFIEYVADAANKDSMIAIFKDEKTLVEKLGGIKKIIDADLDKNGARVAEALVKGTPMLALKRTGMTKLGVKKYNVTKIGASFALNIGDDKDNMVPVFVYNKPAKIIAFYMDPKIFDSIPKNKFLADVLAGFMGVEEEIITNGFQNKFKGATPTATAIKINFGGMKTVKAEGTGIFTLKNEKLVYKAGNALTAMGAATEEIETVEGATEIATDTEKGKEENPKEDKKKASELSQAMKQFQIVLTKANFKGNLGALSKSLGVSPTETEKHLMTFAGKYQGNIPEILSASKLIGGKYAPLTENEFLAYMASLQSILIALSTEVHDEKNKDSKAWIPNMYSKKSYSAFLAAAITAADTLNDVVNSDMKPAKDKKPTRKEDSKLKASQYETLAKEHPKVAEALTNAFGGKKAKAQQLLMYAIEIDKMKAHINMETLPSVIDANPKFFNGTNIEDKIAFVGNLYAEGATIEQINGILTAILYNGIENNFREVEPFKHAIDAIVYVKENGSAPESFKKIESSAFDQSKF